MIYRDLANNHEVDLGLGAEALLESFKNNWYEIHAGKAFDPETGVVVDTVLYYVVNSATGIVEYQGHHLPAVVSMSNNLAKAMDMVQQTDMDLDLPVH